MPQPSRLYRLKTPAVAARQLTQATEYQTPLGRMVGSPLDYELTDPEGGFAYPVRRDVFEAHYTPAPEAGREGEWSAQDEALLRATEDAALAAATAHAVEDVPLPTE